MYRRKSDMSTPAPRYFSLFPAYLSRLSETKSRSSSKLLESSIHPGSRSRSQSRLESLPSPSRQKGSVSDAAKNALLQSEEAEEITNHKHPQKHGMKHHVPVY